MKAYDDLRKIQQKNKSHLCVGLDLDPKKMPSDYAGSLKGMFEFAHKIIDATSDLVCAYKPNMAFYESLGPEGLSLLKLIVERIPEGIPVILDGKRGDIGNTAAQYATSLFETYHADWITINPYMGLDSMQPFLNHKEKGIFVLCLTSNAGSQDFQQLLVNGKPLYMEVAEKMASWNKDHNCGLVVGATHPEQLKDIRRVAADMPLLIPGVGAQGGSLEKAIVDGTDNFRELAVINVSRSVLYASKDADFAQRARQELQKLNSTVAGLKPELPKEEKTVAPEVKPPVEQPKPQEQPKPEAEPQPKEQGQTPRPQEPQPPQQSEYKPQEQPERPQDQKPPEESRLKEQPQPQQEQQLRQEGQSEQPKQQGQPQQQQQQKRPDSNRPHHGGRNKRRRRDRRPRDKNQTPQGSGPSKQ